MFNNLTINLPEMHVKTKKETVKIVAQRIAIGVVVYVSTAVITSIIADRLGTEVETDVTE